MFDLDAPVVRDRRPRHPRDAVLRPRWSTSIPSPPPTTSTARCRTSRASEPHRDPSGAIPGVQPAGAPDGSDTNNQSGRNSVDPGASEPSGRRDALVVTWPLPCCSCLGVLVSASFDRLEPFDRAHRMSATSSSRGSSCCRSGVTVLAVRQARRAEREAALRADADEQIRALVAESPVVSFTWLPREHRYRYVSPQVEALLGVTAEEHDAGLVRTGAPGRPSSGRGDLTGGRPGRRHLPGRIPHHPARRQGRAGSTTRSHYYDPRSRRAGPRSRRA